MVRSIHSTVQIYENEEAVAVSEQRMNTASWFAQMDVNEEVSPHSIFVSGPVCRPYGWEPCTECTWWT